MSGYTGVIGLARALLTMLGSMFAVFSTAISLVTAGKILAGVQLRHG
ncbi:hypothetical protein [Methylobacterium nodulans]|uniref:Uncharacterized protein n=1 Tax=Methylobacterium nodulans (strain LMG 21967 / CNCM I-2342 / ORS 2060) TaxID=460265 RepID=B8IA90_METNO|nr:hypothetical protein [Methylobacterium nodulans]ACL57581.1 hypothetical protein Mnod_2618 [Methylobacterium nodulans ORS 2060]ACL59153.1 hypothetical protein Mnod_4277 [Methylobacterium nodulans ORS 2060]